MFDDSKTWHRFRRHHVRIRKFDAKEFCDALIAKGYTLNEAAVIMVRTSVVVIYDCSCGASWSWTAMNPVTRYFPKGLSPLPERVGLQEDPL